MEEAPKSNLICVPSHPFMHATKQQCGTSCGRADNTRHTQNGFEGEKYKHLKIVLTVRAVPSKTDLMYTHHVMLIAP